MFLDRFTASFFRVEVKVINQPTIVSPESHGLTFGWAGWIHRCQPPYLYVSWQRYRLVGGLAQDFADSLRGCCAKQKTFHNPAQIPKGNLPIVEVSVHSKRRSPPVQEGECREKSVGTWFHHCVPGALSTNLQTTMTIPLAP